MVCMALVCIDFDDGSAEDVCLRARVQEVTGNEVSVRLSLLPAYHWWWPPYLHLDTSEVWCWSGERGILIKLSLCYSIVYCHNGAQWYEQFLQVGRLYRALVLLGLDLWVPSTCLRSLWCCIYTECLKKSSPPKTFLEYFPLWLSLFAWNFAYLLAIYIHMYLPIFMYVS